MKTKLIFLIVFILNVLTINSQEDEIIYYSTTGQITSADKASEQVVIKKVRKNTLLTQFYSKINDTWELTHKQEKVKIVNDSTYIVFTSYSAEQGETITRKYSK